MATQKKKLEVSLPLGRPSKFKEEYCKMLEDHMADGYTFASFAGTINVNIDTIHEWCKHHVNFSESKKAGRAKQLLVNEKTMRELANGKLRNGNVTAQIFIMKNCHGWRDRIENTNIDISKEDTDKLKAEAKKLLEELEGIK